MTSPATPALILVVDDEPYMLKMFSAALTAAGFEVATAQGGAEAIQVAKARQPTLVLMDVKMPVMNGIETFRAFKGDPETKDIKVVFLTAYGDPNKPDSDVDLANDVGVVDFIRKETNLKELVDRVRHYTNLA